MSFFYLVLAFSLPSLEIPDDMFAEDCERIGAFETLLLLVLINISQDMSLSADAHEIGGVPRIPFSYEEVSCT